jgi:hypothetical protein
MRASLIFHENHITGSAIDHAASSVQETPQCLLYRRFIFIFQHENLRASFFFCLGKRRKEAEGAADKVVG